MFGSEIKDQGVVGDMESDCSAADEDGGENSGIWQAASYILRPLHVSLDTITDWVPSV